MAPVKGLTILKLELCGVLLTTKLLQTTAVDIQVHSGNCYGWTDSQTVFSWLCSTPMRLKVFLFHCVRVIQELMPSSQWHHVPTQTNPADFIQRGHATQASSSVPMVVWSAMAERPSINLTTSTTSPCLRPTGDKDVMLSETIPSLVFFFCLADHSSLQLHYLSLMLWTLESMHLDPLHLTL